MKKRARVWCLAVLVTGVSLIPLTADAQRWRRRSPRGVQICLPNQVGQGRLVQPRFRSLFYFLWAYYGAYLPQPSERCGDGIDNNCNGEVDEGCAPPDPVCGNGIVEGQELCDDGNGDDLDDCRNDCTLHVCGDLIVGGTEECENDQIRPGDVFCTRDCQLADCPPGPAYEDDLEAIAQCSYHEFRAYCGDGIVNPTGLQLEECDDGNDDNFDGCRNDCTLPLCGDGIMDRGEQCDDGNTEDLDDCRNDCTEHICGDGIVGGQEECENTELPSGFEFCNNRCKWERCPQDPEALDDIPDNWQCNYYRRQRCGNGVIDPGEQCDDGNRNDDDNCDTNCQSR